MGKQRPVQIGDRLRTVWQLRRQGVQLRAFAAQEKHLLKPGDPLPHGGVEFAVRRGFSVADQCDGEAFAQRRSGAQQPHQLLGQGVEAVDKQVFIP